MLFQGLFNLGDVSQEGGGDREEESGSMSLFALSIMTYILVALAAAVIVGCVVDRIVAFARWVRRRPVRETR